MLGSFNACLVERYLNLLPKDYYNIVGINYIQVYYKEKRDTLNYLSQPDLPALSEFTTCFWFSSGNHEINTSVSTFLSVNLKGIYGLYTAHIISITYIWWVTFS